MNDEFYCFHKYSKLLQWRTTWQQPVNVEVVQWFADVCVSLFFFVALVLSPWLSFLKRNIEYKHYIVQNEQEDKEEEEEEDDDKD